jgi:hypothetical protein
MLNMVVWSATVGTIYRDHPLIASHDGCRRGRRLSSSSLSQTTDARANNIMINNVAIACSLHRIVPFTYPSNIILLIKGRRSLSSFVRCF